MMKTYFIPMLVFCIHNSFAQHITVKGSITDSLTAQPLADAVISIHHSHHHTHSDKKGTFYIAGVAPASYEVEVEKPGYETKLFKCEFSGADTILLEIVLVPKSVNLTEVAIAADKPVSAASSGYINQLSFSKRPKNSAQDLLRVVPGLFIAQHAGGGKAEQVFIRGFDCDHGTDIAVFADGIPVNLPSHGHGHGYADLHFLIPETVEGIKVFKGTSSVLYGDFATAAAVEFKTFDTLTENLVQIEAGSIPGYRNLPYKRSLAMLKIPVANRNISSYFAAEFLGNNSYFSVDQALLRSNIFFKTTYSINEVSKFQLSCSNFGSAWNASGQIPERAVTASMISRYGSIDPHEGGTSQRSNYNLTYTLRSGKGEWETQAYGCSYNFKLFSNFTFYLNDSVKGDMIEQNDTRTIRGINLRYGREHQWGCLTNRLTIGSSFRVDQIENQLWKSPLRIRQSINAHAKINQRTQSFFMNEAIRINPRWRLELGLRYDYFLFDVEDLLPAATTYINSSGYNSQWALNPKLNLIFSAHENARLFVNAGSGFHSNDARSVVREKKNHHLPIALSAETGLLLNLSKTVFSTAIWLMEMENELVYVGDEGTTENKGSSRRYGVDVSIRTPLLNKLFFDLDINLSQALFTDTLLGNRKKSNWHILLAPLATSSGGIVWKMFNNVEVNIRYRYINNRPANESATIMARGYQLFDGVSTYKVKRWRISLSVENMLNVIWNEAQFATETKLKSENKPVDELCFTPGSPRFFKLMMAYCF